jgi:two-component system NarL family sensor kinase
MRQIRFLLFTIVLLFFLSANCFALEKKLSKKEITALLNDARNNRFAGDYEKSLLKSRVALEQALKIKDNSLIAYSYLQIAASFDELSETDKALNFYNIGLFYANKTNNSLLKNQLYNNLGNIYCFDKKQYNKGIYYYKKSILYSQKILDKKQLLLTKLNVAWAYFDICKYDEGLPYLEYINKFQIIHGSEASIVAINMLNGMYYSYKNNTEKAHYYFKQAIEQGNIGDEKSDLSFSHLEYSNFLFKIGDYKKAFDNLTLYNKITEELHIEDKLNKANIVGVNLEIDEYKREIDKIETQYKTKQSKLLDEQSRNKKIVIIVLLLLIITIIFFYYFIQNIRLKQKNKLNAVQSKIQQNIINATIDGQELERKKIAAFLHDNISSLLSSAGLHLNVFTSQKNTQPEEILKTKTLLEEAHNQIRNLSHALMPALLVRFGLLYALDDLCEKNSNSSIQIYLKTTLSIKKRYNEEFEMKLYFIITELLNNIAKHSKATKATVSIEEIDNQFHIEVTDNGSGFVNSKFELIEGFGINQIRARINNMQGEVIINSILNIGTTITLKVPILHK